MKLGHLGPLAALCCAVLACGGGDAAPARSSGSGDTRAVIPDAATVPERWITQRDTTWNVDTPALWVGADGSSQVLVTAKGTHDLKVFDGATGATLAPIGGPGTAPGRFQRPNAVVVAGDLAFVVERDNHRVQVLRMPEAASVGTLGDDVLERPYGVVVTGTPPDLVLWITDDYEGPGGTVPADLTRRVHRLAVHLDGKGSPTVRDHRTFGDADGEGALEVVETIGADLAHDRIFVADEARKEYLVYDTVGTFVGGAALAQGRIQGDPEGMALVRCGGGDGYWIVTDQQPQVSLFRVFRRGDLSYVGTFRGEVTANTDGVSFAPGPVPGFPGGVFLAVHEDQAVSAFDWTDVTAALALRSGCGLSGP